MYRNPLYKHETEKVVNNLIYAVSLKENANDFCVFFFRFFGRRTVCGFYIFGLMYTLVV